MKIQELLKKHWQRRMVSCRVCGKQTWEFSNERKKLCVKCKKLQGIK